MQQGELSMVCVGLSERALKNFGGATGGPGKILGGQWPSLVPPLGMANAEPYEFLELLLDETFWELLTVETNQYMALKKVLSEAQEKHLQALGDVTMPEIKKYFAISFAMGIVPQCNLKDYWQAKNVITQTPAFHAVFHIQPGTCNKVLIV